MEDESERPIAFVIQAELSQTPNGSEHILREDGFAVNNDVNNVHQYMQGRPLTILTDYLMGIKWHHISLWDLTLGSSSIIPDVWDPSPENLQLRLSEGGSRCAGRLEIFYRGQWGTVCDDEWGNVDAGVVCRQLGCGNAWDASHVSSGPGSGPIWLDEVQCSGDEPFLWNCSSNPWGEHDCRRDEDVKIMCSEHKQLRLADGGSPCAGRVEVYYNEKWGSVCDDSWDLTAARLVCKQLGCGDALQLTLPASCVPGTGPIWLNELDCFGNESFLWDCPKASRGSHDCSHKEDVKVMCSEHKELRLVNGKHRCEGRVEIFYNGIWGTLCSDNVDKRDAEVICKQLQCGPHMSINYDARSFGEGSGPIWLDEIDCGSHESTLWQCQSNPWGQHNCYHREDASVVCSGSGLKVRLVGGNTRCSGRVEILCNNTWDTVCDDSWDMADADVVCRQLDCGLALQAPGGAAFGTGDGAVWLDEVRCTGSESILSDCPSSAANQPDCHHKEDASVICSDKYVHIQNTSLSFNGTKNELHS
ncbi:deleted in malignant brain tumors 1 protein-like [Scyliorhinus canicula]|uniref:deleted in malignant brain tumors 1 protein-like n=1 Tax=Scyliorhinus canicula TaxID=7830 RepID=UPI0018F2E702|nr:deleted in malignant brain tumors 1 protein-like [Scyliorhinus canicula]